MPLHLLSLPQEVRNNIYAHVFEDFDDLVIHVAKTPEVLQGEVVYRYRAILKSQRHWSAPQTLEILTICKQLYQEIMSFIHSHLPIMIDGPELASGHLIDNLPAPLTAVHVANVANLVLDCRDITFEAVPTQQQQDIVARFPALRKVTVLAQSSLVRALGYRFDMIRLWTDPISAYDIVDDEATQSAVKRHSISTWSEYESCHLKNGSGRPVDLQMSSEVGRFAIDCFDSEDLPDINQILNRVTQPWNYSRHRILGSVLAVEMRAGGEGQCNVSIKLSEEFRQLHDDMLRNTPMWKWWYIDFCYV